jgi:hypothetical protein
MREVDLGSPLQRPCADASRIAIMGQFTAALCVIMILLTWRRQR